MHSLNRRLRGRISRMAIKLDMEKAYDRVNWEFIEWVMRMGIHEKWIRVVMQCISTVSYALELNGVVQQYFKPKRGPQTGMSIIPIHIHTCWGCPFKNAH